MAPAIAAAKPVALAMADQSRCTHAKEIPSPIGTPTERAATNSSSSGTPGDPG
jgi:hypothetical protein